MDSVKIGYNDYDLITPKLIKKYNLDIPYQIKDIILRRGDGELQLLDEERVDKFINELSDIDLYEQKNMLIKSIKNE